MAADLPTLIRSHARWRLIFLGLALVVPLLLEALFDRQIHRLYALADHGREATAIVSTVEHTDSGVYTHYGYSVGGASYTWSVTNADAPYQPGDSFPVTYLPEDPSLSRPGPPPSTARAEAIANTAFTHKAMLVVFAFFLVNAGLSHAKLRTLRQRVAAADAHVGTLGSGYLVSPVWLGRGLALLFLAILLSVNFDAGVRAVQEKAFGAAPLGLPVTAAVSVATVILYAPYFWVMEHVMRIVVQAREDGASLSKVGLFRYLLVVGERRPELQRSRNIVLAGLGYFFILVGLWIAYADARGI